MTPAARRPRVRSKSTYVGTGNEQLQATDVPQKVAQNLPNYTDFEIPPRYQSQQPIAINSPIVKPTKIKMSVNQVAPYQPTKFPPYHFTPSSPYHSLAWMSPTLACHRAHRPPCHYHDIDEPFKGSTPLVVATEPCRVEFRPRYFGLCQFKGWIILVPMKLKQDKKNYWILYFWWGWVVLMSRKGWKIDLVTCEGQVSLPEAGPPSQRT